ncbi:MAG: VOC family protein [Flavobacteriaceae bacterium]
MYKFSLIAILLLFGCSKLFSQPADLGVGAVGLVVSDLKKSQEFYTDVIGMKEVGGFELSAEWAQEAGMSDNRPFAVKIFKMRETNTATMLKLAYFDEVKSSEKMKAIGQSAGVNYITFYLNELRGVKERIKNANITVIGEVERDAYTLIIVQDPDGVFVELIELR